MRRIRPLLSIVALLVALDPRAASAQLGPASETERAIASLARDFPAAHLVVREGRVRVASRLRARAPGSTPEERATRFLERWGAAFGVGPGVDLRVERVQSVAGRSVVRLRRYAMDLPVLLRSVVVRASRDGVIDLVVAAPGPAVVDARAARVTGAWVAADAPSRVPAFDGPRVSDVREVALPLGDAVRRGFAVDVAGANRPERALLVYDADGDLLVAAPRTTHALGRVYDPNPVVSMEATSDLPLTDLTSRERLTGRYVRVSSCGGEAITCDPRQTAVADASGDFLYDPVEPAWDDPFAEVSAYFHVSRVSSYFRERHGFTWTCCGGTSVMEVVANYSDAPGTPYDNAAYSPSECSRSECGTIVLGQGTDHDFAYDGDVIYHEYTHSVVDETAGIVGFDLDDLGISYEPLGINEGTADYFSATIGGDPRIAEYFAGLGSLSTSASLRELDSGTRCPEDIVGEGHLDGRVWSGTLWSIREMLGADKTDALVFLTLGSMVDNTAFADAADLLVASAEALVDDGTLEPADLDVVTGAVSALGLAGCRRIVPLDDHESHTGYSGMDVATGDLGGSVAPVHYSLEVPADATAVRLHLDHLTPEGRYTYYFRWGEPLRFVAGGRPPLLSDATADAGREVVLGRGSDLPLTACTTLYVALVVDDLGTAGESVYELRAELDRTGDAGAECGTAAPEDAGAPPVTEVDGGVDPGDAGAVGPAAHRTIGGGGGCACDASATAPAPAWLGLLLVAWAWRRGRRSLK